jgi:hypothetical protein
MAIKKPQFEHILFGRNKIKVIYEPLKGLDGYFETNQKLIVLDSRIKGKRLFNTIIHEIFHVIAYYSKIKFKNMSEEQMAIKIGDGYTKIFKQNPKLWKLLTKLLKG